MGAFPACHEVQKHCRPSSRSIWKPDQQFWVSFPVPVSFASREMRDAYEMFVCVPGLSVNDVEVQLSEDGSMLHIVGCRLPTAEESAMLQRHLAQHIRDSSPSETEEAYAHVAHGTLGRLKRL